MRKFIPSLVLGGALLLSACGTPTSVNDAANQAASAISNPTASSALAASFSAELAVGLLIALAAWFAASFTEVGVPQALSSSAPPRTKLGMNLRIMFSSSFTCLLSLGGSPDRPAYPEEV